MKKLGISAKVNEIAQLDIEIFDDDIMETAKLHLVWFFFFFFFVGTFLFSFV